jgi:hypothetical protein
VYVYTHAYIQAMHMYMCRDQMQWEIIWLIFIGLRSDAVRD